MKTIISSLLNLFFPPTCVACGTYLPDGGKYLCLTCLSQLPKTDFYKKADNPNERLLAGRIPFIRAASYIYFEKEGILQSLIHELKYRNNPELGVWLGRICGEDLKGSLFLRNVDYIIPVPLHPKRERTRGYNQSFMLAKGLSESTTVKVRNDVIKRIVNNKSQTTKTKMERLKNISGVFRLNSTEDLEGKHILLLDDLLTTGATLEECAKTILQIPKVKISILTFGSVV